MINKIQNLLFEEYLDKVTENMHIDELQLIEDKLRSVFSENDITKMMDLISDLEGRYKEDAFANGFKAALQLAHDINA